MSGFVLYLVRAMLLPFPFEVLFLDVDGNVVIYFCVLLDSEAGTVAAEPAAAEVEGWLSLFCDIDPDKFVENLSLLTVEQSN